MMQAAQQMMANMKPEDMQRMSQMAANMDPSVMGNMMKNMGGQAPDMDPVKAAEQMKNMTPDQIRAGMSQAQQHMSAQKQYMYNAAEMLKKEGNDLVKQSNFSSALAKYTKGIENLKNHSDSDVLALQTVLLNNSAHCHLKMNKFEEALKSCDEALKVDPKSFKAYFRRGQAQAELGRYGEAVADVRKASELCPNDTAIGTELARLRAELKERGLQEESFVVADAWQPTPATSVGSRSTSSSSTSRANPQPVQLTQSGRKLLKSWLRILIC